MDLLLDTPQGLVIRAYEPGEITINENDYRQNLLITPTEIITDWQIFNPQAFTLNECERILQFQPTIILFGTGAQILFPSPEIIGFFGQHRIGCETMSTAAACRTYNILLADARRVVAVLTV